MGNMFVYFGILGFIMVIFSFLTGMRIIKIKAQYRIHKKIGIVGFGIITIHAVAMLYYYFFT